MTRLDIDYFGTEQELITFLKTGILLYRKAFRALRVASKMRDVPHGVFPEYDGATNEVLSWESQARDINCKF